MEMLADLRMRGVTPFLTLFHFACPKWLAARGGWAAADAPGLFADFAARVAEMVDGEVLHWITINEPVVHAFMAYVMREFPPQKRLRFDLAFRALCNMARGHALAWRAIKERLPAAEVGITKHCKHFAPLRAWHPIDRICAFAADRFFDRWGLGLFLQHGGEPVSTFLGVNYYGRMRFRGLNALSPLTGFDPEVLELHGAACDDMWEQDPAGLADCLAELSGRIELPLYVTENGVATRDEDLREQYMVDHLRACHEAIRRRVNLRGYFYWTLMDNFEWGEGLSKRFGLLDVDFSDRKRYRRMRPAARRFGEFAAANAVTPEGALNAAASA
jgi:beta-glucosidase